MSSPTLNLAARVLKLALAGTPADQALRESLGRERHFSAPAQRREVSRAVFAFFRWWRWLEPQDSLQRQLATALDLQARFNRDPATVKAATLAARAVPEWLQAEMDVIPVGMLRQFQREPSLWLRTRRGSGPSVAGRLGDCVAHPVYPEALRYTGVKDLHRTPSFQGGEFEIQDLASQLVGHACAPQPGETWWDACAGEGGKTLHLADLMQNKGLIWASDRSLRRLQTLQQRAARAKVFNYRSAPWEGGVKLPTKTRFDGVLVDAPCSGVGTWQRNPHARWTTTAADVHELAAVQGRLLNHVAGSLKPGGRLVYSVCTLTRAETTAVAEGFSATHPEFEPAPLANLLSPNAEPVSQASHQLVLWPQDLGANGMFLAAWRRKA